MGYIQGADRNQVILLPDTLDDYVGGDNEVRAIDAFIHLLDIPLMGFKEDPAKEDIAEVLDYLERCKAQLTEALEQMAGSGENHICTTDPENHLIVYYDVTSECTDWHLLGDGINASKAALGVENLEGIADRGYSNDEEILQCLLNGDTPTTHPNKGEKSRMFRFRKTNTEVTGEMLFSKDKDTILQCISAGELPEILHRGDVELEVVKRREQGSSLYLDKETGEIREWEPPFPVITEKKNGYFNAGMTGYFLYKTNPEGRWPDHFFSVTDARIYDFNLETGNGRSVCWNLTRKSWNNGNPDFVKIRTGCLIRVRKTILTRWISLLEDQ